MSASHVNAADALLGSLSFESSGQYWEERYVRGYTSGAGSYGEMADFKADFVNRYVDRLDVHSVIEWGCGDGNQLSLLRIPLYLGMDVSKRAVELCASRFADDATKSFFWYSGAHLLNPRNFLTADMTLSLEVIFHLVEDDVFDAYMCALFDSSRRHVLIFATDFDEQSRGHMRSRKFTDWVAKYRPQWGLALRHKGPRRREGTQSDFFCFVRS